MNKSEQIQEIAGALAKVQGALKPAKRESTNPFFKSKYADMQSVWDSCRKLLSDNGLSVIQTVEYNDVSGVSVLCTTLLHSSGQWLSGRAIIKPVKDDPQGFGSAMTYQRRYGLMAIIGIATEDDDGNAASAVTDKTNAKPKPGVIITSKIQAEGLTAAKIATAYVVTLEDTQGKCWVGKQSYGKLWSSLSDDVLKRISEYKSDQRASAIAACVLSLNKLERSVKEIEAKYATQEKFQASLKQALAQIMAESLFQVSASKALGDRLLKKLEELNDGMNI